MEALMREIQPEFLVWRAPTRPVPQAQGHVKRSPEKLVAGLSFAWTAREWAFLVPREQGETPQMSMVQRNVWGSRFQPQAWQLARVEY